MLPNFNACYIRENNQPLFVSNILSSNRFEKTVSSSGYFCSANVKFVTPTVCVEGISPGIISNAAGWQTHKIDSKYIFTSLEIILTEYIK
jgi:hypothetical protein